MTADQWHDKLRTMRQYEIRELFGELASQRSVTKLPLLKQQVEADMAVILAFVADAHISKIPVIADYLSILCFLVQS